MIVEIQAHVRKTFHRAVRRFPTLGLVAEIIREIRGDHHYTPPRHGGAQPIASPPAAPAIAETPEAPPATPPALTIIPERVPKTRREARQALAWPQSDTIRALRYGQVGEELPDLVWKDVAHASAFRGWLCTRLMRAQGHIVPGMSGDHRAPIQARIEELRRLLNLTRVVLVDAHGLPESRAREPLGTDAAFAAVTREINDDPRFSRFYRDPNAVLATVLPMPTRVELGRTGTRR